MQTTHNEQLKKIIDEVGSELIWRPVTDFSQNQIADGIGYDIDGIDPEFKELSFENKTVCDLGCNLGHYSFYACRRGASKVTGYDIEPKVITGAQKICRLYGIDSVDFKVCNFAEESPEKMHDMGMLIDILGKRSISKGLLVPILKGLEKRSRSEMLLTFRPEYYIEKHFNMTIDNFKKIYPEAKIENGKFKLLDFVCNLFAADWNLIYVSSKDEAGEQYKHTVFFRKK
ncbi:class I SAM-dependent methyltransferase [Maridesulfovibrio bastinii]|uniref:class I SAM-dependent methyltransferase n=1 Tax=Maridesulfovibrio bastinii TaxID=47157 RepID=UPI000400BF1C|nr:methyltransferase domain-containing protein [Maridesulfovibrio bastinii]